ncbi:Zinc finger BED domain-containing protein DAYSLEEPER [Linum perenne]
MVPVSEDTKPTRRRKQKSHVWEYFTVKSVDIDTGCKRAFCNHCGKSFAYSMGSKVAGTSHLKRHIEKGTCGAPPYNGGDQSTPFTPKIRNSANATASAGLSESRKRKYRTPSSAYAAFNADNSRHDIARMIIMHDYPLDMVEHPGFVSFVQSLQPQFSAVSFNTIQGECVASYLGEKQKVMQFIQGIQGRVCLSLDLWMSKDSLGYVFITGHFTDSSWKTQKWILNVVLEPYPDSHNALSHAVACCLSEWRLENKLLSLTLNHAVPEAGLDNLRSHLCVKNPHILNGQLLLGKCISHTFTAMVKDVLWAGRDIIRKIRDNIKYVTTSESHEEKFFELKQQLQVPSEVGLFLDDQSQWNTTYQMLVSASDLKEVFSCLDTLIHDYKAAPSMEDWKQVEIVCSYLKSLFDAMNILITSSSTCPPAVILFQEALRIHTQIACAATSGDPFTCSFIRSMQERLDQYWRECGLVLAISVVMDPRFKMKLVEFSFSKIFGEESPLYIKMVDDGLHQLFDEYLTLPIPPTPTYHNHDNMDRAADQETLSEYGLADFDYGLADFDVYIMETSTQQLKSEIDQYLDENLVGRSSDFDVLDWWRQSKVKYPTLSKMARDILSIPVSTVAPEHVYSTTPRELSSRMSSVRPETLEALVCTKDWLQHGLTEEDVAVDSLITDHLKIEF